MACLFVFAAAAAATEDPSIAAIYIWLVLLFLEEHSKMDFDSSLCAILNWQTIGAVICFVQIELDKKDSQTDGEKMNKE